MDTEQANKVILVREMSPEASAAIERFKEKKDIKTTAKAVVDMLETFWELQDEIYILRGRQSNTESIMSQLIRAFNAKEEAESSYKNLLDQLHDLAKTYAQHRHIRL